MPVEDRPPPGQAASTFPASVPSAVQTVASFYGGVVRSSHIPTNSDCRLKSVAQKIRKNSSTKMLRPLLMFESHLMPRPTPDMPGIVAALTMTASATKMATVEAVPPGFSNQAPPLARATPATNCSTP